MCDSGWGFWPLTGLSPTSGTGLKEAAADHDINKTLPCSGRKMSPSCSPRPGDLRPRPLPTIPQATSGAPGPCQETNTRPFPEGRSQNQLLEVMFTNKALTVKFKAAAWGWVTAESLPYTKQYSQLIGKLGKPLGLLTGIAQDQGPFCSSPEQKKTKN